MNRFILGLVCAAAAFSQTADPAYAELDRAYRALHAKNYDEAIAGFEKAIALAPDRPSIRKDLAYTLLKIGENASARDQFAEAMRLDPGDQNVALEYAFLCYETHQETTARRVFDRYRASSETAARAFENIDRPLREGIARWKQALAAAPDNFSGHVELARLAEQRDEIALAAEHYEQAWRLRPDHRELLLDLGRVWKQAGRAADANAALLAASRGAGPRTAESARELLPGRYPYASEFERALELDPSNVELRRELAYLDLQVGRQDDAEKQFTRIVEQSPGDLLSAAQLGFLKLGRGDSDGAKPLFDRVLAGDDEQLASRVRSALKLPPALRTGRGEGASRGSGGAGMNPGDVAPPSGISRGPDARSAASREAKELGLKSFEKGYLRDALRYLTAANEADPVDFDVMLKLGWTNNMLKNDSEALRWFSRARLSPDAETAAEAAQAYRNLEPSLRRFRTTVWAFPVFSTRWHDLFGYSQAKTEIRMPGWFLRPYISLRFVGDTHGAVSPGAGFAPQYLSESAAILGAGAATKTWRGLTGWFEAGEELRYRPAPVDLSRASPDYRGGASYAKGFGHVLAPGSHGLFAETNDDLIYVRRFDKDTLVYAQNRTGYTLRQVESSGFHAQLYWNWNITADLKRQYWANYAETGPGLRFRAGGILAPVLFSIDALEGAYLVKEGNPRGPRFHDLRLGIWYAFSR